MNIHFPKIYFPLVHLRGLRAKLLWPIAVLMLLSSIAGLLTFIGGTAITRNQLLNQKLDQNTQQVSQVLVSRASQVQAAAQVLARDSEITSALKQKTDSSLADVDARAVLVRNRFGMDLIQIYDAHGSPWVNLVTSSLYQVSSLLLDTQSSGQMILPVQDRLLLVSRTTTAGGDTVITGVDLGNELERIARDQNINAVIGLQVGKDSVTSDAKFHFATLLDQRSRVSKNTQFLVTGQTHATLIISQSTIEIDQITQTGLWVVIAVFVLTTMILIFLGILVLQAIIHPIQELARVSNEVTSKHDFSATLDTIKGWNGLNIGENDEIGQLSSSFQQMLLELRDLYQGLETKVAERTKQITMTSEIARVTTSSLDLDRILRAAVEQICSQFNFYFAGVFIMDFTNEEVSLRQAAGMATIVNEIKRFNLSLSRSSLITSAIKKRETLVVQDVSKDDLYLPMELLPDTRSEAVFPLIHAGMVVGVLDIQSSEIASFSDEFVKLFSTLAVQIATAVQNAIVYDRQRTLTRRLAEIDHLKAQLLDTMSHELRTPLNSIIGFSKVILMGVDGEINDAQRTDITSIRDNGMHLLWLVNDFLDMGQFEAGEVNLDIGPMNLRQEILYVISHFQEEANKKAVHMEMEIPLELPPIPADSTRIRQVLTNLVANALKFTEKGAVTISACISRQWVVVNVQDSGIGIAAEDMGKLFQTFSQVDGSTTRQYGGMGLGLSISRYLIELHGGHIWADSQPGLGSTFSFTIPLNQSVSRASSQLMDVQSSSIFHERTFL